MYKSGLTEAPYGAYTSSRIKKFQFYAAGMKVVGTGY